MDENEKIKMLEREVELLKEIIKLKDSQKVIYIPYCPQPAYPVRPIYPLPWPNYPQPYIGDMPWTIQTVIC